MSYPTTSDLLLSWSPFLLILSIAIIAFYLYLVGPARTKFIDAKPVSNWKKTLFISGIILFFLAEGSPVNQLGHYLFLVHMTQQSIIYLAVPPLILSGIPSWLIKPFFKNHHSYRVFSLFTKPLISILLFNTIFSFYHIPFIFDTIMGNMFYMNLSIIVLLPTAFMMWWPIFSPIEGVGTLKPLYKIAYIFGMGILLTPACALIIFSESFLYETYLGLPRLFGISLLDDQQSGGIIMKIMQEIIYGSIIFFTFFQWVKYDRKKTEELDRYNIEQASKFN
ncbi:cytochrome c oxidase assembly protein [Mesobacillus maritimus]|uniref:cytochrome c oxidase assembly protein n=1 Tax=Mesobacillus maritimus TaxID=1643336 RepID=UPI00203CAF01|nr:cytochrome c oxidase assembly protein [Mesobacillus maritimus]MCM3668975.1 cytochrome c oxidase assembly protein [Mesobacillus maritimus]